LIEDVAEMQALAVKSRTQGKLVALVATSGALHAGHLSLIEAAREQADVVVVSIFVNPLEFGPAEDFDRYPRDLQADLNLCTEAEVDVVFAPSKEAFLPAGFSTAVSEEAYAAGLGGISRPHFYKGACTRMAKLFNIVRPDYVLMGRKDPQLAAVIRKMIDDLGFTVDVVLKDVVRDDDGLAVHARNRYLNEMQRKDATRVYAALQAGKALVAKGTTNADRVLAEITHQIRQGHRLRVIYVQTVNPVSMAPQREIVPGETLLVLAVWCDEVRLNDCVVA